VNMQFKAIKNSCLLPLFAHSRSQCFITITAKATQKELI